MAVTTRTPPQTATLPHLPLFPRGRRHSRVSFLPLSPKVSVVMRVGGETGDLSNSSDRPQPSLASEQVSVEKEKEVNGGGDPLRAYGSARIHDFCFGIPYGGFLCCGGLLGFVLSRNPKNLVGALVGGALLALSTLSLKVWRRGDSSLPFVLGQAVLSGFHFWRSFRVYSLTKKLIPAGLNALIGAGMLSFYCYVVISGGNPPPKKLKASVSSLALHGK